MATPKERKKWINKYILIHIWIILAKIYVQLASQVITLNAPFGHWVAALLCLGRCSEQKVKVAGLLSWLFNLKFQYGEEQVAHFLREKKHWYNELAYIFFIIVLKALNSRDSYRFFFLVILFFSLYYSTHAFF